MNEARLKPAGARRAAVLAATLLVAGLTSLCAVPLHAVENAWAPGTNWLSLRGGYAKMASDNAPNGAAGYGFGYTRMLGPWWIFENFSLGANVHHELLGRFAGAALVDVPFAVELDRHFLWSGGVVPYVGVGAAAHYLKGYRYPDAPGEVRGGPYLVGGANLQVNPNNALGFDVRVGTLADVDETYLWSIKLNYAWVY